MSRKDLAALLISTLALAVAVISAYRTHFSERLDVTAILSDDQPSYTFRSGTVASAIFDTKLVLVNNGNRPVAITNVALAVFQVDAIRANDANCKEVPSTALYSESVSPRSFNPLVIGPSNVGIVPLQFSADFANGKEPRIARAGGAVRFQPSDDDPEGHIRLITCLAVQFVAPNEDLTSTSWYLQHVDGETRGKGEGGAEAGSGDFRDGRAAVLVRKTRRVF